MHSHPGGEASPPAPSCLCVYTPLWRVWGGGDRRPRRRGDALGPRSLGVSVPPGLVVVCVSALAPGLLGEGSRAAGGPGRPWGCVTLPSRPDAPLIRQAVHLLGGAGGWSGWAWRSRGRSRVAPPRPSVDPWPGALCGCSCPRLLPPSQILERISALCAPPPNFSTWRQWGPKAVRPDRPRAQPRAASCAAAGCPAGRMPLPALSARRWVSAAGDYLPG